MWVINERIPDSESVRDWLITRGFRWSPVLKKWFTTSPDSARLVGHLVSDPPLPGGDSAIDISLDGFEDILLPYQVDGVKAMVGRNVLLADEMGLGKSVQVIVLCSVMGWERVLVVIPAYLLEFWVREVRRWVNTPVYPILREVPPLDKPGIYLIGYSRLEQHIRKLKDVVWDAVILDEAHYIKEVKSKRSRIVRGWLKGKHQYALTGTPILNRPYELWSILNFLRPDIFYARTPFLRRYCNLQRTRFGWDYSGVSNLEELKALLSDLRIFIRRTRKEVLAQYTKVRQVFPITVEDGGQIEDLLREELRLVPADSDSVPVEVRPRLSQIHSALAMVKIPFVKELLQNGEQAVIVAVHHAVVDSIASLLGSCVVVDGRTPVEERDKMIRAFLKGGVKYLVGTLPVLSLGWNLTPISRLIVVETGWVPALLTQMEDRFCRPGQVDPLLVQYMVIPGSLEDRVVKVLLKKEEVGGSIFSISSPLAEDLAKCSS